MSTEIRTPRHALASSLVSSLILSLSLWGCGERSPTSAPEAQPTGNDGAGADPRLPPNPRSS